VSIATGHTLADTIEQNINSGGATLFDTGTNKTQLQFASGNKSVTITLDATDAKNYTAAYISGGKDAITVSGVDSQVVNGYSLSPASPTDSVTVKASTTTAPSLTSATVYDTNSDGSIDSGDILQLGFNGGVADGSSTISSDLVVAHGTLTSTDIVAVDIADPTKLDITLSAKDSVTNVTTVNIGSGQTDIIDAFGNNVMPLTSPVTNTVNASTSAPAAPVVTNSGYINAASSKTYKATGTAAAGSTINVTFTDSSKSTATDNGIIAQANGSWSSAKGVDLSGLADGAVTISATATNVAGNTSTAGTAKVTEGQLLPNYAKSSPIATSGAYTTGDVITLTFNEPVSTTTLVIGALSDTTKGGSLGKSTLAAVSPSNGFATSFTITLDGTATVSKSDTIEVSKTGAVDAAGNPSASVIDFTAP